MFGFNTQAWVGKAVRDESYEGVDEIVGTIVFVGLDGHVDGVLETFGEFVPKWKQGQVSHGALQSVSFLGAKGPVWVMAAGESAEDQDSPHGGYLDKSPYAVARDMVGATVGMGLQLGELATCKKLVILTEGADADEKLGVLVGLEMGSYQYRHADRKGLPELNLMGFSEKMVGEAGAIGCGTNLARHLVNVPAGELNPRTYAAAVAKHFEKRAGWKVDVWDTPRLKKAGMGMLLAVGQAASEPSRLVHVSYRPRGGSKAKPLAFVGKGITFDSGGLDIKPAAGMRLMKKDMGGSAAIMGLAHFMAESKSPLAADFYIAAAENAIAGNAFRPGDVLTAKNGVTVEIDNTDAEGRLVLGDALCLAAENDPAQIINVATLTGAMKVALGAEIFGFFSNNDDIADRIADASYAMGDLSWRMPLFAGYEPMLHTPVADCVNSAGRFGGAITAALFLEKFVGGKPWAHFDIFAWSDAPNGAVHEKGGSGQAVQALIGYVTKRS